MSTNLSTVYFEPQIICDSGGITQALICVCSGRSLCHVVYFRLGSAAGCYLPWLPPWCAPLPGGHAGVCARGLAEGGPPTHCLPRAAHALRLSSGLLQVCRHTYNNACICKMLLVFGP